VTLKSTYLVEQVAVLNKTKGRAFGGTTGRRPFGRGGSDCSTRRWGKGSSRRCFKREFSSCL